MNAIAINFHLYKRCNARCLFCFATFHDVCGRLSRPDARRLIRTLRRAGGEKLTFVGGEPTLHPNIGELVALARKVGFVVCVVTNGAMLNELLDAHASDIDWVGLSVDSGDETVQQALGRGQGDHIANAVALADRCHSLGVRLKLNTVVTSLTCDEDLSGLVRRVRPARWKVFQVLPIKGQNDGAVEPLLVDASQFQGFIQRHAGLAEEGFAPVVEANDAMRGSYVMIDPLGRFYGNATGRHVYSEPILQTGVAEALSQVGFDPKKFAARGGRYAW